MTDLERIEKTLTKKQIRELNKLWRALQKQRPDPFRIMSYIELEDSFGELVLEAAKDLFWIRANEHAETALDVDRLIQRYGAIAWLKVKAKDTK